MSPRTNRGPRGLGTSMAINAGAQLLSFSQIMYSLGVRWYSTPLKIKLIIGRFFKFLQLICRLDKISLINLIQSKLHGRAGDQRSPRVYGDPAFRSFTQNVLTHIETLVANLPKNNLQLYPLTRFPSSLHSLH